MRVFRQFHGEVRRIPLPRTSVNNPSKTQKRTGRYAPGLTTSITRGSQHELGIKPPHPTLVISYSASVLLDPARSLDIDYLHAS
jgi:hypothetical protein